MSNLKPLGDSFIGKSGAFLYGGITALRNKRFDLFPPKSLPFPVISVGGISAGGTGKTPLTATIIEYLIAKGYTPILFSRGYGRSSKETRIIPSDGTKPGWQEVGDEPAMLRNRYPELWLAIDGNRMRAVESLLPSLPERAVGIMDDGFQHRKMHRDLNIVTLPDSILTDRLIPQGLLRESLSSLSRADCICIMTANENFDATQLKKFNSNSPIGLIHTELGKLIHTQTKEVRKTLSVTIDAFSGIARPERFQNSLLEVCKNVRNFHTFPDHHIYSDSDLEMLKADSETSYVTTEKDWIRTIGKNSAISEKLWYLTITQRFAGSNFRNRFFDLIDNCLESSNDRSSC